MAVSPTPIPNMWSTSQMPTVTAAPAKIADHPTGEAKFARLSLDYLLHGTPPPEQGRLDALAARFRSRGLITTIGGQA
jgi:hypothetical protein